MTNYENCEEAQMSTRCYLRTCKLILGLSVRYVPDEKWKYIDVVSQLNLSVPGTGSGDRVQYL